VKVAHFFLAGGSGVGVLERVVLCILYFSQSSKLWETSLFQATCYMCRHSLFC
jgi:hypothetical protein